MSIPLLVDRVQTIYKNIIAAHNVIGSICDDPDQTERARASEMEHWITAIRVQFEQFLESLLAQQHGATVFGKPSLVKKSLDGKWLHKEIYDAMGPVSRVQTRISQLCDYFNIENEKVVSECEEYLDDACEDLFQIHKDYSPYTQYNDKNDNYITITPE